MLAPWAPFLRDLLIQAVPVGLTFSQQLVSAKERPWLVLWPHSGYALGKRYVSWYFNCWRQTMGKRTSMSFALYLLPFIFFFT